MRPCYDVSSFGLAVRSAATMVSSSSMVTVIGPVLSNYSATNILRSGSLTMVEVEHATQPLAPLHSTTMAVNCSRAMDQLIPTEHVLPHPTTIRWLQAAPPVAGPSGAHKLPSRFRNS